MITVYICCGLGNYVLPVELLMKIILDILFSLFFQYKLYTMCSVVLNSLLCTYNVALLKIVSYFFAGKKK